MIKFFASFKILRRKTIERVSGIYKLVISFIGKFILKQFLCEGIILNKKRKNILRINPNRIVLKEISRVKIMSKLGR